MATPSFAAGMKQYFGLKEGQTLGQFQMELKELTHEEKQDFADGLRKVGFDIADPVAPAASA